MENGTGKGRGRKRRGESVGERTDTWWGRMTVFPKLYL